MTMENSAASAMHICNIHPKRTLRTGKSRVRQKLVGLKDDIIYFLLQQVDAEIRKVYLRLP